MSSYVFTGNNPVMLVDPDGRAALPYQTPKSITHGNQIHHSFSFSDNGRTTGNDIIRQTIVSTTKIYGKNGKVLQQIESTVSTVGSVDLDGQVTSITQTTMSSIKSYLEDGSWTRSEPQIIVRDGVELDQTEQEFQDYTKFISNFKKENFNLSPIQVIARENEDSNKTTKKVASGVAAIGRGATKFGGHPVARGAGVVLTGIGSATAIIVPLVNPDNPEKIILKTPIDYD
jgi:hypothetical protein